MVSKKGRRKQQQQAQQQPQGQPSLSLQPQQYKQQQQQQQAAAAASMLGGFPAGAAGFGMPGGAAAGAAASMAWPPAAGLGLPAGWDAQLLKQVKCGGETDPRFFSRMGGKWKEGVLDRSSHALTITMQHTKTDRGPDSRRPAEAADRPPRLPCSSSCHCWQRLD